MTAVECPSGLRGTVRGLRVREEQILSDRGLARAGGQIDALLRACWETTVDPGPYTLVEGALRWDQVLVADRFVALLQVRIATYGPSYVFQVPCGRCGARIEWELNLDELPVRSLGAETRAAFAAGNRLSFTLPAADRRVTWRLLTGEDERALPQLRQAHRERVLSASLAHRVVEIDGVEERQRRVFLEDLGLRDVAALTAEFERVEGGVETQIDVECAACGAVQEIELPFQASFLLPTRAGRSAGSSR